MSSDNAVNPDGAICIAPLIKSCLTLKKLILNNTGVGPAGGDVRQRLRSLGMPCSEAALSWAVL